MKTTRIFLNVVLVCLVLAWPRQAPGEQNVKKADGVSLNQVKPLSKAGKFAPVLHSLTGPVPKLMSRPDDVTPTQLSLDWTNCQMHRVNSDSQIELILSGSVTSPNGSSWTLTKTFPEPGGPPNLCFVEDVFGRSNPGPSVDIPLAWEISLDGGSFKPMEIQRDNSLSVTFPSGSHTFKVRITGLPQHRQADGYYQLILSQNLTPLL